MILEIFQVRFPGVEVPVSVDEQVGVLVWNDHLSPHVEPLVDAWVDEQRRVHGRRFVLMHIDAIVKYVREHRLQVPFRQALRAEGLLP